MTVIPCFSRTKWLNAKRWKNAKNSNVAARKTSRKSPTTRNNQMICNNNPTLLTNNQSKPKELVSVSLDHRLVKENTTKIAAKMTNKKLSSQNYYPSP